MLLYITPACILNPAVTGCSGLSQAHLCVASTWDIVWSGRTQLLFLLYLYKSIVCCCFSCHCLSDQVLSCSLAGLLNINHSFNLPDQMCCAGASPLLIIPPVSNPCSVSAALDINLTYLWQSFSECIYFLFFVCFILDGGSILLFNEQSQEAWHGNALTGTFLSWHQSLPSPPVARLFYLQLIW